MNLAFDANGLGHFGGILSFGEAARGDHQISEDPPNVRHLSNNADPAKGNRSGRAYVEAVPHTFQASQEI